MLLYTAPELLIQAEDEGRLKLFASRAPLAEMDSVLPARLLRRSSRGRGLRPELISR
jgi:hypothetical protein